MKVADLTLNQLNYAVAVAEGLIPQPVNTNRWSATPHEVSTGWWVYGSTAYEPASNQYQGGEIIDRERIATEPAGDGWAAIKGVFSERHRRDESRGKTRLEAAMRARIRFLFGEDFQLAIPVK